MKFKGILLVFFVVCEISFQLENFETCGNKYGIDSRIVGGEPVNYQAEWPWLIAFFNRLKESFLFSGSLISRKHVVSGEYLKYI